MLAECGPNVVKSFANFWAEFDKFDKFQKLECQILQDVADILQLFVGATSHVFNRCNLMLLVPPDLEPSGPSATPHSL